jgi:protocatechuate 3,4-dioxygenase beta subunit
VSSYHIWHVRFSRTCVYTCEHATADTWRLKVRKRMARTLGLVLLVVASASMPAIAQQAPLTIHGRVFAADNRQPLRHARVVVFVDGDPAAPTTYTDDRGAFSIAAPSAASFTLSVIKATFAMMQMPLERAALTATRERELSIALARAAAINGRVVDPSGEGIVGLPVYGDRLDKDAGVPAGLLKFMATTDDRGEYRLGGLPPGRYSVTATNALDPGSVATLVLRPGDDVSEVDFRAQQPPNSALTPSPQPPETRQLATIRGRVLSSTARPIRQAIVTLSGPMVPRSALTDSQGRFTFPGLIPGDYEVSASVGGWPGTLGQQTSFESTSHIAVSRAARVDGVTLVLSRGLAVTGTIVDRTGEPLQGVPVVALQLNTTGDERHATPAGAVQGAARQTDDRGRYRVLGLQPGKYIVAALADAATLGGGTSTSQPVPIYYPGSSSTAYAVSVTVATKDVEGIDFALGDVPTARVTGMAFDSSGAPLAGTIALTVSQRSGSIVPSPRTTQPNANGAFTFVNVAPGDYVLQATRSELGRAQGVGGVINPLDAVEFDAQFVSVGDEDAEPVRLRTARGTVMEGRVVIDSTLQRDPYERMQIEGRSVDPDFSPMRTSDVARSRVDRGRFRITGLFGVRRFVLSGMPAGWYLKTLTINGNDATDQAIDFGVGAASTVVAELVISARGGTIAGRVTGRTNAVAASSVVVFPQNREHWVEGSRFIRVVRTSRDGSFRAMSLPPGNYYVAASNPDASTSRDALARILPRAAKVTLNDGAERIVEIPLP